MSSPKDFNFMSPMQMANTPVNKSKSQSRTNSQSPISMEVDDSGTQIDSLSKIRQQEVIPELFTILHSLRSGKISAKDFDNKLGSIRLKLNNVKQYLRQIDGITESVEEREERINLLTNTNEKKIEFLNNFSNKQ